MIKFYLTKIEDRIILIFIKANEKIKYYAS